MLICYRRIDADIILASILVGMCFHVVYGYFLSVFHVSVNLIGLVAPSVAAVIALFKVKNVEIHLRWRDILVIVPFFVFVVICFNIVPPENVITDIVYVQSVIDTSGIPSSYLLYTIPIKYPLGFHFIVYEMNFFKDWNTLFLSGAVITSFLFIPSYLIGKKMHSEKAGWFAGIIVLFVSVAAVKGVSNGLYSDLLSYTIQGLSIYCLLTFLEGKTLKKALLLGMVCAAGIEIHTSFLLIVPVIVVFMAYTLRNSRLILVFFGVFLLGSLPYLLRYSFDSPYEVLQFSTWVNQAFTPEMITTHLGAWVVLLGILGIIVVEKKYVLLFGLWMSVSLFFMVNKLIGIPFLYWYTMASQVTSLCVPLSVLAAVFMVKTVSRIGVIFLFVIMLITSSTVVKNIPRATPEYFIPPVSEFFINDQEAMLLLEDNTYVLNDWWKGTGSAWILPLTGNKTMFPYLNPYDRFIYHLDILNKEKKAFVVAALPDLEESLQFLKEEGIDYIFLSGYVTPEEVWRRKLWDAKRMSNSPNYELVFQKKDTYVFKVLKTSMAQQVYPLSRVTGIPASPEPVKIPLKKVSFCPDLYLKVVYVDTGYTTVRIAFSRDGEDYHLATIPRTNTQTVQTLYFRLPYFCKEPTILTFYVDEPLLFEEIAVVTSFFDTITISENIALKGTSRTYQDQYIASSEGDCYIYFFSPKKYVKITYIDDSVGNVDFNLCNPDGFWEAAFILSRKGDGLRKDVYIELPEGYSLIHMGIHPWDNDFLIVDICYEEGDGTLTVLPTIPI